MPVRLLDFCMMSIEAKEADLLFRPAYGEKIGEHNLQDKLGQFLDARRWIIQV